NRCPRCQDLSQCQSVSGSHRKLCHIATKPLNITQQMRQILLSISPEIVPNVLTTDDCGIRRASDQGGRPSANGRPFTFRATLFTCTSVVVDVLPSRFHTILIVSVQMQFVICVRVVVRRK